MEDDIMSNFDTDGTEEEMENVGDEDEEDDLENDDME